MLLATGCATSPRGPAARPGAIVAKQLVKTNKSWDGALLPAYPLGQPEVTIKRITLPAGARLETHRHPVINAGVLVAGQLTVITTHGKKLHLQAGDPIVELVNTPHFGVNEGQVPAEIIVVYAGTVGTPVSIAKTR